jgi:hypothetical protein
MSNLHDLSWGTKGLENVMEDDTSNNTNSSNKTNVKQQNYGSTSNMNDYLSSLEEGTVTSTASSRTCSSSIFCCCYDKNLGGGGLLDKHNNTANKHEKSKVNEFNFMLKTMAIWLIINATIIVVTNTWIPQLDFMNFTMSILFILMIIRLVGSITYACQRYKNKTSPWWSCCVRHVGEI